MTDDPSVRLAVEAALTHDDIETLLTSLIRVALGRRAVLVAAIEHAESIGDPPHQQAASRLRRALELKVLWGDDGT